MSSLFVNSFQESTPDICASSDRKSLFHTIGVPDGDSRGGISQKIIFFTCIDYFGLRGNSHGAILIRITWLTGEFATAARKLITDIKLISDIFIRNIK